MEKGMRLRCLPECSPALPPIHPPSSFDLIIIKIKPNNNNNKIALKKKHKKKKEKVLPLHFTMRAVKLFFTLLGKFSCSDFPTV